MGWDQLRALCDEGGNDFGEAWFPICGRGGVYAGSVKLGFTTTDRWDPDAAVKVTVLSGKDLNVASIEPQPEAVRVSVVDDGHVSSTPAVACSSHPTWTEGNEFVVPLENSASRVHLDVAAGAEDAVHDSMVHVGAYTFSAFALRELRSKAIESGKGVAESDGW